MMFSKNLALKITLFLMMNENWNDISNLIYPIGEMSIKKSVQVKGINVLYLPLKVTCNKYENLKSVSQRFEKVYSVMYQVH